MSYQRLTSHQKRVVFSSSIGNALEFYDFTLCGVFIPILAIVFFPKGSELAALLGGIFAFSAAFWTRPLGAILFGNMGDKEGRKKALSLTVMFMGIPTMMIGFLPSFETIGVAAPLILVALRMVQGLCTGGEYNGAAIFALEHAEKKSGFISGLIAASCVAGAVLATIMGISLARYGADSIAWRLAFVFGGIISVIGFYIRKKTNESLNSDEKKSKRWFPIKAVVRDYKLSFVTGITSGAFNGILSYTLFGFSALYLNKYMKITSLTGLEASFFGMFAFMMSAYYFGKSSDTWGIKLAMEIPTYLSFILIPISFTLFHFDSVVTIVIGQLLLGLTVGSFVGPSHAFLQQLFPMRVRYTGVAVSFCVGMAITGGTTALVLATLLEKTNHLMIPAYYVMATSLVWYVVHKIFVRHLNSVSTEAEHRKLAA